MAFQIIQSAIPLREARYLIREPQPVPGAPEGPAVTFIAYDLVVPGLYPDEHVAKLDTGALVAISVSTSRMANGGGMEFLGWARAIEADGSTKLDKHGQELELQVNHPVNAAALDALETKGERAAARVSREIILLLLGEEPTLVPVHVDPDAKHLEIAVDDADYERSRDRQSGAATKAPPGTLLDPEASEAPLIGWSDEVRLNHSIRHALKLADHAEPEVDVATLLRG